MKDINLLPDWYHHGGGVENKMILRGGTLFTVVSIGMVLAIAVAFNGPLGADGGVVKQKCPEPVKNLPVFQPPAPTDNHNEAVSKVTERQNLCCYNTDPNQRQQESVQMDYVTVDTKDSNKRKDSVMHGN
ncbi:MAG: hypothetical protein JXD22_04040 [Sedimentisphaerales bacterium]|nr:hypothetical protein [Sedimentisphaerales bacterium]